VKLPVAAGFVPFVAARGAESFLFIDHVVFDIASQLSNSSHFERTSSAVATQTHAGERNLFAFCGEIERLRECELLNLFERKPTTMTVAPRRRGLWGYRR